MELAQTGEKIQREYQGGEDMPLLSFAVLGSLWVASLGFMLWRARKEDCLPERMEWRDALLLGVGSHKLARILTRDKVTSFLRAPFTRFQETAGQGTVHEKARGRGLQKAVGQLLTCPYCAGGWTSAALTAGLIFNPPVTRWVCGLLAVHEIADLLHMGYYRLYSRTQD